MKIKATIEQVEDGLNGGCLSCGRIIEGEVEPDARNYECEYCGKKNVFGLEELVMMDKIQLIGEDDEEFDDED